MPDVVDAVFGARDQEAAEVHRPAVLDDWAAEECPRRVVTARRPVPRAADQIAAADHHPACAGAARRNRFPEARSPCRPATGAGLRSPGPAAAIWAAVRRCRLGPTGRHVVQWTSRVPP